MEMEIAITLLVALLLDWRFGEPKRYHPLVGFGRLVSYVEAKSYADSRVRGTLVTFAIVVVGVFAVLLIYYKIGNVFSDLCLYLMPNSIEDFIEQFLSMLLSATIIYLAIGWRSLREHAVAIANALQEDNLDSARLNAAKILSRDTSKLNEKEISSATIESILENGNDALFAVIFWYCVLGETGVVAYRLVNTLDAMWGYKSSRYLKFGWAAARLDDVMNYVPARLVAISYAIAGKTKWAILSWFTQARHWKSPNAGPVMAAGAGSLGLCLGGAAVYHGEIQQRPVLGRGESASVADIDRALALLKRGVIIWMTCIIIGEALATYLAYLL